MSKESNYKPNGVIPYIYRRLKCFLWNGHNYRILSPEIGSTGKQLIECKNCGKRKFDIIFPCDIKAMEA